MLGKYLLNLLIALDQFGNAIAGGDPKETISSRIGKWHPNSVLARIINFIFFWQKNHVKESIEPNEGKDAVL